MSSRGAGARQKGANFERWLAKYLSEHTQLTWERGLGQTRGGGQEVADVVSEELPWLHIEAKNQARCNIKAAMKQAVEDCRPEQCPVVVSKDTRDEVLVTMRLDDWLGWLNFVINR